LIVQQHHRAVLPIWSDRIESKHDLIRATGRKGKPHHTPIANRDAKRRSVGVRRRPTGAEKHRVAAARLHADIVSTCNRFPNDKPGKDHVDSPSHRDERPECDPLHDLRSVDVNRRPTTSHERHHGMADQSDR